MTPGLLESIYMQSDEPTPYSVSGGDASGGHNSQNYDLGGSVYDNEGRKSLYDNEGKKSLYDNEGSTSAYERALESDYANGTKSFIYGDDENEGKTLYDNEVQKEAPNENDDAVLYDNATDVATGESKRNKKKSGLGMRHGDVKVRAASGAVGLGGAVSSASHITEDEEDNVLYDLGQSDQQKHAKAGAKDITSPVNATRDSMMSMGLPSYQLADAIASSMAPYDISHANSKLRDNDHPSNGVYSQPLPAHLASAPTPSKLDFVAKGMGNPVPVWAAPTASSLPSSLARSSGTTDDDGNDPLEYEATHSGPQINPLLIEEDGIPRSGSYVDLQEDSCKHRIRVHNAALYSTPNNTLLEENGKQGVTCRPSVFLSLHPFLPLLRINAILS